MGWLKDFKDTNDITFQTACVESALVGIEGTNMWFYELYNLTANYDKTKIFNVDETGLLSAEKSLLLRENG